MHPVTIIIAFAVVIVFALLWIMSRNNKTLRLFLIGGAFAVYLEKYKKEFKNEMKDAKLFAVIVVAAVIIGVLIALFFSM